MINFAHVSDSAKGTSFKHDLIIAPLLLLALPG